MNLHRPPTGAIELLRSFPRDPARASTGHRPTSLVHRFHRIDGLANSRERVWVWAEPTGTGWTASGGAGSDASGCEAPVVSSEMRSYISVRASERPPSTRPESSAT
jgi:hypothetical protein